MLLLFLKQVLNEIINIITIFVEGDIIYQCVLHISILNTFCRSPDVKSYSGAYSCESYFFVTATDLSLTTNWLPHLVPEVFCTLPSISFTKVVFITHFKPLFMLLM